ncbi:hypothetical protein, partial [Pseudomonas poae]|uniref:hypothetical protein n=1 Tax=Pseudomonas poae TaxID=200451 RepID=UPI0034D6CE9B
GVGGYVFFLHRGGAYQLGHGFCGEFRIVLGCVVFMFLVGGGKVGLGFVLVNNFFANFIGVFAVFVYVGLYVNILA